MGAARVLRPLRFGGGRSCGTAVSVLERRRKVGRLGSPLPGPSILEVECAPVLSGRARRRRCQVGGRPMRAVDVAFPASPRASIASR